MRAAIALIVLVAAAQAPPQTPPRAAAPAPTIGTASISGTVMTDEPNPRPLRRAVITVGISGGVGSSRMTSTDDDGRFALIGLPAGTYTAPVAAKPGYVSRTFGAARVGGIGTPITLAEGQAMRVEFRLLRGAVITGTVFDQGRPAPQTGISVQRVRDVNGVRTPDYFGAGAGGSFQTDDRGTYRVFGLAPGDYVVSAYPRFTGGGELRAVTDADIEWAQRQFQNATTTSAAAAPAPPAPGPAVAYSPVYFPGTTTASAAGLVTLVAGQERSGVDFSVRLVTTAKVEGVVLDLDGQPTDNAQVNLVPRADMMSMDSMMLVETMMMNRQSLSGGRFSIAGVRPGDYTLVVRGGPRGAAGARGGGSGAGGGRGQAPAPMTLWASTDLTMDGADQSGLVVRLMPGIDLKGRVEFDESGTAARPAMDTVRVRLTPAPTAGTVVSVNIPNVVAEADGSFTLPGVTPGRYLITGYGSTGAWVMKSARVGAVDVGDVAYDVMEHRSTEIVVTFTDKVGELSGTLFDANHKPTSQLSIILFPTDPAMWANRGRRLRQPVRASTDGKFRFTSLLEGEYYLAALADFEQADVYKPEFLEQVAAAAMKVTIGPGEKKVQDLKIAK